MEAMCTQCGMHYEVPEELLQQSPVVACPTCQVALVFVQPGTNIPLEPQPSLPPSPGQQEQQLPVSIPPAAPAQPSSGWQAGDLLWGGLDPGSQQQVGQTSYDTPSSSRTEPSPPPAAPVEPEPAEAAMPPGEEPSPPAAEPPALQSSAALEQPAVAEEPKPSFETPLWQPAAPPAVAPSPEPAAPAAEPPLPESAQDDWATAAARWAASGFAAEAAPTFMRKRTGETPAGDFPAAPAVSLATPDAQPQAEPPPAPPVKVSPPAPPVAPPPALSVAQPPSHPVAAPPPVHPPKTPPPIMVSAPAVEPVPPPIPNGAPPGGPPPLRSASSYIMKGSGDGKKEDAPWGSAPADEIPPAVPKAAARAESPGAVLRVQMGEPAAVAGAPLPRSPKPGPVEVPRPPKSNAALVIVLILLLAVAAVAGIWYWKGPPEKWPELLESLLAGSRKGELVEVPSLPPKELVKAETPAQPTEAKPEAKESEPAASPAEEKKPQPPERPPEAVAEKKPPPAAKPAAAAEAKKPAPKPEAKNPEKAKQLYQEGNRLVKEKKLAEAVAMYKKALDADPTFLLAHRGLGIAYASLNRPQEACREYRQYYKMLPPESKERPQLEAILKSCK